MSQIAMSVKNNVVRLYHTKGEMNRTLMTNTLKSIKLDVPTFDGRLIFNSSWNGFNI